MTVSLKGVTSRVAAKKKLSLKRAKVGSGSWEPVKLDTSHSMPPPPSHETGDSNDERADDDDDALSKHERRLVQRAISG